MNTAAQTLLSKIVDNIINPALLVLFALALLLFVWGIVKYLKNLSDGKNDDEGKKHMIWGIVGMTIMVSVYGIIGIISNTLGLGVSVGPGNTVQYQPDPSLINNINLSGFHG